MKIHHWKRSFPFRKKYVQRAPKAIVLIHGIYSDSFTFNNFYNWFENDYKFDEFELFYCNYDFNKPLKDNGKELATLLNDHFQAGDQVIIVAHSMGGLISRLAILSQQLNFVKGLFLLGTPNAGALTIAQLSVAAQIFGASARRVLAVYPRKPGIADLTQASKIMESQFSNSGRADHVYYISIPGLYFHSYRSFWNSRSKRAAKTFSNLSLGLLLLSKYIPYFGVRISKPHDGIVERISNNLIPSEVGRQNEKHISIESREIHKKTYAHIELMQCKNLTHVEIQSNYDIYKTIQEIILYMSSDNKSSIHEWFEFHQNTCQTDRRFRARGLRIDFGN